MIAGVRNPQKLAQLADRRIKASPKALYDALHGRLTDHHRFMLRLHLVQYDALASSIAEIDAEVDEAIARIDEEAVAGRGSFRELSALLDGIPGICERRSGSVTKRRNGGRRQYLPLTPAVLRRRAEGAAFREWWLPADADAQATQRPELC